MKSVLFGARTHFSSGQSILSPKTVVELAHEAGYDGIAIADVNSINAMVDASNACNERGMKLIIGATIKVVDDLSWRRAARGESKKAPNPFFMPSLYVKNDQGMRDLTELLTKASDEDHFYFTPQLTLDDVIEVLKRGNLTLSTGTTFSLFSHVNYKSILQSIIDAAGTLSVIVEATPVDTAYFDRVSEIALSYSVAKSVPIVYSRPILYKKGSVAIRNTMNCILDRAKVTDMWRNEPNDRLHVLPPKALESEVSQLYDRIGITDETSSAIDGGLKLFHVEQFLFTWKPLDVSLPKMAGDSFKELVAFAKAGWTERLHNPVFDYQPSREALTLYRDRLSHELIVVRNMGFENYFLMVRDLMKWSKEKGIFTGVARGSAGGSLLSYLLGITDIDPMRFGLFFERFLNPDRLDWPDIDLDFMSSRREEVIEYLVDKYGRDRVAGISNYGLMGAASALRQVGSAHNLPESVIRCSKFLDDFSLDEAAENVPEIKTFSEDYPEVYRQAVELQGVFRNFGQHAAGVIVAGEPIVNRAVIERRKLGNVVNWDKRHVESFGLIKLDILGLSTLDLLAKANEYIRKKTGSTVDLLNIPLDDAETLKTFGLGETLGIFQFEGGQARHLLKQAASESPLTFDDISAITAINRPGPLESGITEKWMSVRNGFEPEDYLIPDLEPILKETYGQIVYQEQVMQVAQALCGFSMAEADHLRKAISKKKPEEMVKMRDKFISGATSVVSESQAVALFNDIEKFAAYSFCKAHAAAYTLISYQSAYIKTKHPAEFYAAALTVLKEDKLEKIVKEAESKNIVISPPDINKSSDQFEIGYDKESEQIILYCPFQAIKGMSEKASGAILQAKDDLGRDFASRDEFISVVNRRLCNKRSQESLCKVGAFASLEPETLPARHPDRIRDQKQLMTALVSTNVKANRFIVLDDGKKSELLTLINDYKMAGEEAMDDPESPTPRLGKKAKIMIVSDFASWGEIKEGKFGEGKSCKPLIEALLAADLSLSDCYVTSLVKCKKPKDEAEVSKAINLYSPFFDRELDIVQPPIIITLGSKVIRKLVPDLKGSWEDICGSSHYLAGRDCTVVTGLSLGMIYFDSSRQEILNKIILQAKEML